MYTPSRLSEQLLLMELKQHYGSTQKAAGRVRDVSGDGKGVSRTLLSHMFIRGVRDDMTWRKRQRTILLFFACGLVQNITSVRGYCKLASLVEVSPSDH